MNTFESLGLAENILKALAKLGFETPTPIQEKAIPHVLESERDIIGLAQTGTGKTAAFSLPLLHHLQAENLEVQALILCPTRELCLQIAEDIQSYAQCMPEINIVSVYGGSPIDRQIKALKRGCHIVVGTPGRTLDLIKRKKLNISNINWLVLDEADEMLSMGFKDELDAILDTSAENKQTLLFSATMPKGVTQLSKKYLENPVEIAVGNRNQSSSQVSHAYYEVYAKHQYAALKRVIDLHPMIYGIVFCRTRRDTKEIADKLGADGYNSDALHGDLSQAQRDQVMKRFKTKQLQILVATDVAARGIDVDDLTHVIHFNLPEDPEAYIHRSGRTGRAGKTGESIAIIHTREKKRIGFFEKKTGAKIERKKVPSGEEICKKQLFNLIDRVEKVPVNEQEIDPFMEVAVKKLAWLEREDLIKHFLSIEFNRFLSYYENSADINLTEKNERRSEGKEIRKSQRKNERGNKVVDGYVRYFAQVGSKDKLSPKKLLGIINDQLPDEEIEIGKIEILKSFSFFEVAQPDSAKFESNVQSLNLNGREVYIEVAQEQQRKRKKKKRRR